PVRERWGTRVGLILAMAGNAVGLGNFLRFPAEAAQNGGGAFLIPYLISFLVMGIPLLWVEWAIGRHGGRFGHHSAPGLFDVLGRARWLKYFGVLGLFGSVTIAAFYCYIESWTLAYVFHSLAGTFREVAPGDFFPAYLGIHEGSLFALPGEAFFWFALTLALNVWILSRGLARGIEIVAKVGMPLLLLFATVLAIRGLLLEPGQDPGVVESPLVGLNFVWEPQLAGLASPRTWLAAAGQVFFTLSLGMGAVSCYASYVAERDDIALNASAAGWMNEAVEVILGSALLIPIATAYLGLAAVQEATVGGSGFGLGFLTLPSLFNNWGAFAPLAGAMWFGLLFFAGVTSSLAMGQPFVAFLEDEMGVRRRPTAAIFGLLVFALGFLCVWLFPGGTFDEFNFWAGTFGLVVFALVEAFVFSFLFGIDRGWEEITRGADMRVPGIFRHVIRWVTPAFLLVVFVGAMVQPADGEWRRELRSLVTTGTWHFSPDSVVGKVLHVGEAEYRWVDDSGRLTRPLVEDATRTLLVVVFLALCWLTRVAWKRKRRSTGGAAPTPAGGTP
ncbi:MAG TPA: sodium-dependent transporter, partial [Thermoanaerobaculia bacterium]|nr:sodium-dependent transporter [Thermoanaerobaculia bacterium]